MSIPRTGRDKVVSYSALFIPEGRSLMLGFSRMKTASLPLSIRAQHWPAVAMVVSDGLCPVRL